MGSKSSAPTIAVRRVESAADRRAFIELPFALYHDDPHWVPPLRLERRQHLSRTRNPYFEHAEVALWLAFRGDRVVGRISAQVCSLHQERYGNRTGQFGFLEGEDDDAVFDALLQTAGQWLSARGMERIEGPFSFSINEESGLLVEGFDSPPSVLMNHAKPYYARQLERLGFCKARDLLAYNYTRDADMPRGVASMIERIAQSGDLEVRPWDMRQFERDMHIAMDIFNDAWADNWGFVPMTYAEVKALGDSLKLLVRGEYAAIASYRGEPAAMAITFPNINDAIADLNGSLVPFGWAKLLWRLKMRVPRTVRMPLMGVRKKYHSGIIGSALAAGVIQRVRNYHRDRGTLSCELSWVLEDNVPVRKLIEAVGGYRYKTYRVFEKKLAPRGEFAR